MLIQHPHVSQYVLYSTYPRSKIKISSWFSCVHSRAWFRPFRHGTGVRVHVYRAIISARISATDSYHCYKCVSMISLISKYYRGIRDKNCNIYPPNTRRRSCCCSCASTASITTLNYSNKAIRRSECGTYIP